MTTSLRDPSGHVCLVNNRVMRVVNSPGLADLQAFLDSAASTRFIKSEKLVDTRFLDGISTTEILKHGELRTLYEQSQDAVIEFVAPGDPMFRRITRGHDQLYTHLTREFFEETCRKYFDLVRSERLDQTSRWLYLMKKKEAVIECFETQQ
jgi:hypothetical protein